jgi:hypothetical protein
LKSSSFSLSTAFMISERKLIALSIFVSYCSIKSFSLARPFSVNNSVNKVDLYI